MKISAIVHNLTHPHAEAINPNHTTRECASYIQFAQCMLENRRDKCEFPDGEIARKCCPIDPAVAERMGNPKYPIVPNNFNFANLVKGRNFPNPN